MGGQKEYDFRLPFQLFCNIRFPPIVSIYSVFESVPTFFELTLFGMVFLCSLKVWGRVKLPRKKPFKYDAKKLKLTQKLESFKKFPKNQRKKLLLSIIFADDSTFLKTYQVLLKF